MGDRTLMGQAMPQATLRPFLPTDTPIVAAIFVASITELTGDDYSETQQAAWASAVSGSSSTTSTRIGASPLIGAAPSRAPRTLRHPR